jgi:hypothetical protein
MKTVLGILLITTAVVLSVKACSEQSVADLWSDIQGPP